MAPPAKGTKRKAGSDEADAAQPTRQKLPVRSKEDDEPLESPKAPAKPAQGTLKVFEDDDDEDDVVAIGTAQSAIEKPAPPPPEPASDEEESDDDEAPEAVSTHNVASSLKKSAQKAAQEYVQKRQSIPTSFGFQTVQD